jgi:hypothetical protein
MNCRPSRDGGDPAKRPLAPPRWPRRLALPYLRGEPLLSRLADPIRVAGSSDLLVVEGKHFPYQTPGARVVFPRLTLST